MDYKNIANLIIQFTQSYFDDEEFADFFDYNDLGVPVAVAYFNDLVTLTSEGEKLLNETYLELCDLFGANPNDEYEDIDDLIG